MTTFEIEIRVAQLSLLILNLVETNFSIWAKKKNQAKNIRILIRRRRIERGIKRITNRIEGNDSKVYEY